MYARARQLREHATERAKRARTQIALLRSEDGSALADEVVAALNAVHTAQQGG